MTSWPDGVLVVDKSAGWTSHDVVAKTRGLARTRRVGHAGTLDPMATGVLLLGIGRATKLLTFLTGCDKDYSATIRLGQSTVTDDAEGEIVLEPGVGSVDEQQLTDAIGSLTGDLQQVPSAVSAIKVDGVRSYHRVRTGKAAELAARAVRVSRFEQVRRREAVSSTGVAVLDIDVTLTVSSGTYVRALARDLGCALGSAGHVTALRRTRVGGFTMARAQTLEQLSKSTGHAGLISLPDAARATMNAREITHAQARALGFGQRIESAQPGRTEPVAAIGPDGGLVAVLDESKALARSRVVFVSPSS